MCNSFNITFDVIPFGYPVYGQAETDYLGKLKPRHANEIQSMPEEADIA